MEAMLYMGGFFPRKHPRDENLVDKGHCSVQKCHLCHKSMFEWKSLEFCPNCEYFVDYWDHGNKKVFAVFKKYRQTKMLAEFVENHIKDKLHKLGLGDYDFNFEINETVNLCNMKLY